MRAISVDPDVLRQSGLRVPSRDEQVAFFLAEPLADGLRLVDARAMHAADFDHQGAFHVALSDHVRPQLITWAWERGLSLVEAHTHVDGDPVCFSPTDVSGLREWVPHVSWRLRGRPYAALVFGEKTVDGVAWSAGAGEPERIAALAVDGEPVRAMTGLSIKFVAKEAEANG